MGLTLRQAAEKCGKSRSTVHRALKSGKLSGTREENSEWSIDPSELARVFPWDTHEHGKRDAERQERDGAEVLAVKVEMLEAQLERERETVEDLRRRLDRAEERAYALAAPQVAKGAQVGLWERLGRLIGGK